MQADLKSTLSSLDQKTAHFQNHSLSYEPFRENQNKISQVFGASLQRWNLEQILPGNISPLRVGEGFFNNQLLAFLQRRSSLQKKEDLIDFLCVKIFTFRMERIFSNFTRCEPMLFIFFFVTLFVNKPYKMLLWSISRGCESTALGFYLDQVCHLISDMQKWGNLSEWCGHFVGLSSPW